MWSSAKNAGFANLDYLTPADAKKAVAAGDALAPSTTQCLIPLKLAITHTVDHVIVETKARPSSTQSEFGSGLWHETDEVEQIAILSWQAAQRRIR